jgi:pimeloyl-ACP methyl ester carboxylesterase
MYGLIATSSRNPATIYSTRSILGSTLAAARPVDGPLLNQLEQESFHQGRFTGSRMNLHTRQRGASRALLVFIHGLNGKGYKTWGRFPEFMFNDYSFDVAIFDYISLVRRLKGGGASLDFCVRRLADCVRELEAQYGSIYLVGHSLGGLLAEAAAKDYFQRKAMEDHRPIAALSGIVLMASPRAGSARAYPVVRNLFPEGKWLRRGSTQSEELDNFYSYHVQSSNIAYTSTAQVLLPRYICLGGGDRLVDGFSAGFSIPEPQKLRLFENHRSIVKPTSPNDEQVRWIQKIISDVNDVRKQWVRERRQADARARTSQSAYPITPMLITEFWTGTSGRVWEQLYNEVRSSVGSPDLDVLDHRDAVGASVDLLIAVSDAGAVMHGSSQEKSMVMRAHARRKVDEKLTVGISSVGAQCVDARKEVEQWLDAMMTLPSIYVEEAADSDALRSVMAKWLQIIIGRDPRRNSSRSARVEQLIQTDLDPYNPVTGGQVI